MDNVRKLLEGERVEVRQKEGGLRGSWHPAIVVKVKDGRRVVEYDELLTSDGSSKLREVIPLAEGPRCHNVVLEERGFIRPIPPLCPLLWARCCKKGLLVDAFYDDAWWEGILLDNLHTRSGAAKVRVLFPEEGDERLCVVRDIRVSQEWDEASGQWEVRGCWSLCDEREELAIDGLRDIFRQKNSCLKRLWRQRKGCVRTKDGKCNVLTPVPLLLGRGRVRADVMKDVSPCANGLTVPSSSHAGQSSSSTREGMLPLKHLTNDATSEQANLGKGKAGSPAQKASMKQEKLGKGKAGSAKNPQMSMMQCRYAARAFLLNAGWTKLVRTRTQGITQGMQEPIYVAPNGLKFYSLASACRGWKKMNNLPCTVGDDISREMELLDVYNIAKELMSAGKKLMRRVKAKEGQAEQIIEDKACGVVVTSKSKKQRSGVKQEESGTDDNRNGKPTPYTEKVKKRKCSEEGTELKGKKGRVSLKKVHESKAPHGRGRCKMQVLLSSPGRPSAQNKSKSTVLSWLIDKGILKEKEPCRYLSRKDGHVMKKGSLTREGILCKCCRVVFTLSNFEAHAGSKLHRPSANIFLGDGRSITDCQLQACALQDAKEDALADVSDDTCGVCADGGELIICDRCPSTFHPACIGLKVIPDGDWYCPRCLCGVCGDNKVGDGEANIMSRCAQCELEYHPVCVLESVVLKPLGEGRDAWFCGHQCERIHTSLRRLVGKANHLENGFSWMLLRSMKNDDGRIPSNIEMMAEHNVKLGVAHDVMQECFVPMIDPRTKIDLISQALYNRSSKVFRLDYSGFYTIILEEGDEVISVAAIRVHGCPLAEIPLVGTRYQYRRKGMCRRLMQALEQMLGNIGVQKLILPAVPELLDTWTGAFQYKHISLAETHYLSRLNLLTFPGTTFLQKELRKDNGICKKVDEHDSSVDGGMKLDGGVCYDTCFSKEVLQSGSCIGAEMVFSKQRRRQRLCKSISSHNHSVITKNGLVDSRGEPLEREDSLCNGVGGVGEGKKLEDIQYLVKSSKSVGDGLNERYIDSSVLQEGSLNYAGRSGSAPESERPSPSSGDQAERASVKVTISSLDGVDSPAVGDGFTFNSDAGGPLAAGCTACSPKCYVRRDRRELEEAAGAVPMWQKNCSVPIQQTTGTNLQDIFST